MPPAASNGPNLSTSAHSSFSTLTAESRLLKALSYDDSELQMPPSGKLADSVIADFERWIAAGAPGE